MKPMTGRNKDLTDNRPERGKGIQELVNRLALLKVSRNNPNNRSKKKILLQMATKDEISPRPVLEGVSWPSSSSLIHQQESTHNQLWINGHASTAKELIFQEAFNLPWTFLS